MAQHVNPPHTATPDGTRPCDSTGEELPPPDYCEYPRDDTADRLVELLTSHTDISIVDTPDGATVLGTTTAIELAQLIATDDQLVALIRTSGDAA